MGEPGAPEVLLFIVDAGGGHRAAANALLEAGRERGVPWRFEVANIQDVLASADFTRRLTRRSLEDTYNAMVRRRWTRHLVPLLRLFQWGIARLRPRLVRAVAAYLEYRRPSVVISLFPNFNRVLADAVHRTSPGAPFWVLLTDLADFPAHFWMEPEMDRVLVATEQAAAQARALGLEEARVARTSGMVLHPRFHHQDRREARDRVRRELGIPATAFTPLVLFGGKGSPEIEPLTEALLRRSPEWHVVAVCGDNRPLQESVVRLQRQAGGRLHALGFTDRVPDFLAACDALVSKPGPGSLAEALHCRIPLVVVRNAHTIPQERYNARFLEEQGLGLVVKHWREMPEAVARLAQDPALRARIAANLAALPENRAVYEVLDLLEAEVARPPGEPLALEGLPARQ